MVNALVVWAEEGCVLEHKNRGKSSSRRYQPLVSEWGNPSLCKQAEPAPLYGAGGELGELKHLSTQRKRNHMRFRQ